MKLSYKLMLMSSLSLAALAGVGCNSTSGASEEDLAKKEASTTPVPATAAQLEKIEQGKFKTLNLYSQIPYCSDDRASDVYYIKQHKGYFVCIQGDYFNYWLKLDLKGAKGDRGKDGKFSWGPAVQQVAVSDKHTCALLANNSIFCMGDNRFGQIHEASKATIPEFFQTVGNTFMKGKKVATANRFSCAITMEDKVKCWGDASGTDNHHRESVAFSSSELIGDLQNVTDLAAGRYHACAVGKSAATGKKGLYCWGNNFAGQLGKPSTAAQFSKAPVFTEVQAKALSLSDGITCGVEEGTNAAFCFGDNRYNQMALGTAHLGKNRGLTWYDDRNQDGTKLAVRTISAGGFTTCVILADASKKGVYCSGASKGGVTGLSRDSLALQSSANKASFADPIAINQGFDFLCAVGADRSLMCDGSYSYSADEILGNIRPAYLSLSVAKPSGPELFSVRSRGAVSKGGHLCEILFDNTLQCWGNNKYSQSVLNSRNYREIVRTPERIQFPDDPNQQNVVR